MWIGLSIAAPVGPIGVLVIQRCLAHGAAVGLATGLGAAVADAAYGAIGAFGVTALIAVLQGLRVPLVLAGSAFLFWLAWRTWPSGRGDDGAKAGAKAVPADAAAAAPSAAAPPGLLAAFASTFGLTLSNPATILSFIAIFGSMASSGPANSPAWMVAGVLLGSALWWLCLVLAVAALRERFGASAQRGIARLSALMLAAFALWQLGSLLLLTPSSAA